MPVKLSSKLLLTKSNFDTYKNHRQKAAAVLSQRNMIRLGGEKVRQPDKIFISIDNYLLLHLICDGFRLSCVIVDQRSLPNASHKAKREVP